MDKLNRLELNPDNMNNTYSDRAIQMSQAISLKRIADALAQQDGADQATGLNINAILYTMMQDINYKAQR